MARRFLLALFLLTSLFANRAFSQGCCSGGSASPVAGGVSQGVLMSGQMEISSSYQYYQSNRFKIGDKNTDPAFKNLTTQYSYTRLAYGITKRLTFSLEAGYFFDKSMVELSKDRPDYVKSSSGFSDLIIFPRYSVYSHSSGSGKTEITVGLGYKIPVGTYNAEYITYIDPGSGAKYYAFTPPSIQLTTGSHDFIFYGFLFRSIPGKNIRLFSNMLYVKKGENPLGQQFGDYASIGLNASKTFFKNLGVTLQLKGEMVSPMRGNADDMLVKYSIDITSTGSRKLFFVPQLSYTLKKLTVYAFEEIPLYQYMNGVTPQLCSQYQFTFGGSYRFMPVKKMFKS